MVAMCQSLGTVAGIALAFYLAYGVRLAFRAPEPTAIPPPVPSAFPALTPAPYDTARPYPRPGTGGLELELDRTCPWCGMEDPGRLVKEFLGWPAHRTCTELAGAWEPMVPFGPGGSFPGAADRPWSSAELPGQGRLAVRAWGENGCPDYRWRCLCGATAYGTARTPELAHASAVDGLGSHRRSGECL
jgi:hypothetical protein